MKTNFNTYVLFFLLICFCCDVKAQGNPGQGNNPSLSATFDGGLFFDTYAKLEQGLMLSNISVDINKFTSPNWRLEIYVQQNFMNADGVEVSLENFLIEFNNGTNPITSPVYEPVVLNLLEELEILRSPEPLPNGKTKLNFDFRMIAGDHLLMVPNGTYETTIRFALYEEGNPTEVISTEETFSFIIDYLANDTNQVLLTELASLVELEFDDPGDLINGRSEVITNGLQVTTDDARELLVKAASPFFDSGIDQIDIALLHLSVGNRGAFRMDVQNQSVLTTQPGQTTEDFDLEFSIPAGELTQDMAPGLYTGYVIFSIIPD